ncbi:hypothetical protein CPB84DRAFT_1780890 [Gymnopilus junonius]|uniref:Uncharacterized protein n=1 Tax=Gymnopilus junonius TaxID=109634 RepID=A0A9P5NJE2_GYMJU|nr:hypothetical protein CPB84DRAFT_1780890 [Gymnopilus junonius]
MTTRRSSQVMKTWRDVILNYPMLQWAASLDFGDSLRWIQEVFKRAGTSLITLAFLPFLYKSTKDNDMRMPQLCRHLTFSETADLQALPHLESFILFSSYEFFQGQVNLFDGTAPRLRSLNIVQSRCPFTSAALQQLSSLCVIGGRLGHTVPEWLEILSGMPKLSNLTLEWSFLENASVKDKPGYVVVERYNMTGLQTVVMPRLQMLTLKGTHTPCSVIFTKLEFRPSCGIHVACFNTEISDDQGHLAMMDSVRHKMACCSIPHWKEYGVSIGHNSNPTFIIFTSLQSRRISGFTGIGQRESWFHLSSPPCAVSFPI